MVKCIPFLGNFDSGKDSVQRVLFILLKMELIDRNPLSSGRFLTTPKELLVSLSDKPGL